MSQHTFRIELGNYVVVGISSHTAKALAARHDDNLESGKVVGRANYLNGQDQYLVRYRAGDGRMVQQWWDDNALYNLNAENEEEAVSEVI